MLCSYHVVKSLRRTITEVKQHQIWLVLCGMKTLEKKSAVRVGGVRDNCTEREIDELTSNICWVRYSHLTPKYAWAIKNQIET